jgi:hypothetical protein
MTASDVPAAVRRYARHTAHIWLADVDTATEEVVSDTWLPIPADALQSDLSGDSGISGGRLALHPAWLSTGASFAAQLVICNGGFLANERDLDLLPDGATGFMAEVNVAPGTLTILMNREGFTRDAMWTDLSKHMGVRYAELLATLLDRYEQVILEENGPTDAIERGVILLARGSVRNVAGPAIVARVDALLPSAITIGERDSTKRFTLADLGAKIGPGGTVYVVREDEGQQQRTKSFSDAGAAVQVVETLGTTSLRALQLRAAGFVVVSCRPRAVPYVTASGQPNLQIHEIDILKEYAQSAGFQVQSVNDAPADLVALAPIPEGGLITDVFEADGEIRIVRLPSSDLRVIPDFTGRLLNAAHPDIQALFKLLPVAFGNPILRTLVQVYIDIDNFDTNRARQRIQTLLQDPELSEKAQLSTSPHLREYLELKLKVLENVEASHV